MRTADNITANRCLRIPPASNHVASRNHVVPVLQVDPLDEFVPAYEKVAEGRSAPCSVGARLRRRPMPARRLLPASRSAWETEVRVLPCSGGCSGAD